MSLVEPLDRLSSQPRAVPEMHRAPATFDDLFHCNYTDSAKHARIGMTALFLCNVTTLQGVFCLPNRGWRHGSCFCCCSFFYMFRLDAGKVRFDEGLRETNKSLQGERKVSRHR
jgi:hypothetical protein